MSTKPLPVLCSNIFIGFDPPDSDSHEYYGILLPNASENILMLARKLQLYYIEQVMLIMAATVLTTYGDYVPL